MQKYPTLYNKDLGDDEDLSSMDKMDSPSEVKNIPQIQDSKPTQQRNIISVNSCFRYV